VFIPLPSSPHYLGFSSALASADQYEKNFFNSIKAEMYRDMFVQRDLFDDYGYNAASTKAAQLNAYVYQAVNHGFYVQCPLILSKVEVVEYDSREWYAVTPLK
jgi:hypothetical protein